MSENGVVVLSGEQLRLLVGEAVREALTARRVAGARIGEKEAAAYLGIGRSTLADLRARGCGPAYHAIGGQFIYDVSDLDKYLDARRIDGRPAAPRLRRAL